MRICRPDTKTVLGSTRLPLEAEPDSKFADHLIDASSSASAPVHLRTRAAINLFFLKIGDNGLLALPISNRYLALAGVLAATIIQALSARSCGTKPKKTDLKSPAAATCNRASHRTRAGNRKRDASSP